MKVSIRDVAQHAGVSIATVSHVVNQTKHVSEEATIRVQQSIAELGYVPDSRARSFKKGRCNLIGFVIPDISNYFWAILIEEVETVLALEGYHLIIANTKENETREIEDLQLLSSGMVDGLIIGTTLTDSTQIDQILPDDFPLVFIDRQPLNCRHDSITISNYSSIYNGVTHLIQAGHTRIGYICGLMRLSTSQERLQGYRDAMSRHGLAIEPDFVQPGDSMSMSALLPMRRLLDVGCTAMVISNNVMTDDVLAALQRDPKYAGQSIDVVAYQEGNHLCALEPPLALIDQPAAQMGRLAAQQIIARIREPASPVKNVVLSSNLTINVKDS